MKRKHFVISNFICQSCGTEMPLPRCHGQQRENGHIKDIWCPVCKKESKFKEIKYKESYRTMAGELLMAN
jgi:hypothetical protein